MGVRYVEPASPVRKVEVKTDGTTPRPFLRRDATVHLFQQTSRHVQGSVFALTKFDDAGQTAKESANGRGMHAP